MTCPPTIARLLLEIIQRGILAARAASWAGDVKRCEAETDHIHNLPGLLLDYRPELLRYYLNVERPGYVRSLLGPEPAELTRLWTELERAAASELQAVVP
jgi:hypothetical protein